MKSTKYSNFCLKNLGRVFSEHKKDQLAEKNILLVKANIAMGYDEYYALALMNMIIGFIGSFIIALLFHVVVSSPFTLFLVILLPPLVTLCLGTTYLYLPTHCIKKRAENIDLFLPYAINFISSMAVAGISPAEIFQTLSTIDVYGELQTEAKRIAKEINVMGVDNISAIKHAIIISPSRKFKGFLQGVIGTIQSGSDLHVYLGDIAGKYMAEDLVSRKKDLDLLAIIAEAMVIAVIAFPIFLVIILSVMGFFGGSMDFSISILLFFSFLILPLVYTAFYLMIRSTSIEKISRLQPEKYHSIKQFYNENSISFLILFLSASLLVLFYVMTYLLGYFGYLDLGLYFYFDFVFLAVLFLIGPIGIYKYMELKRRREIQERLPEFLVEVGDSLSTGMTIFDAIKVAEKGQYGGLSPEIKKMKAQLSWEVSIKDVFYDFAARMKSAIIQRVVITIDKGLMMGGNTPKIIKAAAGEVDQVNQLENQRRESMSVYTIVILLCFFVFLAIILILDRTMFTSFIDLQEQQTGELKQFGGVVANVVNPMHLKYSLYSFVFVQSLGAGILSGFMMDGRLSSGIRFSCVLGLVSFFVFKFLF